MPTVLGLAGGDAGDVDGVDLGPVMEGENDLAGRLLPAWHFDTKISTTRWQFNRTPR